MLKKQSMKKSKRHGQSTVEYIVLVAAVLAGIIVFLKPQGVFHNALNRSLNTGTSGMEDMANRLRDSR